MGIQVIQGNESDAQQFLHSNSRGSAFLDPRVHSKLGLDVEWWFAAKGSEKYLLLPVWLDENSRAAIPPFSYYFGPCWGDVFLQRPISSQFSDSQKIYKLLLGHLFAKYKNFTFELSPEDLDVRSFVWWNDVAANPKVHITPRYSARITDLNTNTPLDIRSRFRTLRRREVARAEESNEFLFIDFTDWRLVEEGYIQVISRSGGEVTQEVLQTLRSMRLLDRPEQALSIGAIERNTGKLASFIFIMRGKGVANLVVSFTNPEFRSTGVGPLTTLEAIMRSRDLGDSVFDFNGANSPNRGDDKHSYGASPILYFKVSSLKECARV